MHWALRAMSGRIDRVRAGTPPAPGGAPFAVAREDGAFASMLTPGDAAAPPAEAQPAAAAGVAWLQANVADVFARAAQDREARRHGRALLAALAGLQRAALAADGAQAHTALAALAATVDAHHEADDPVLRLILREIGVRAAVELARAEAPGHLAGRPIGTSAQEHVSNA